MAIYHVNSAIACKCMDVSSYNVLFSALKRLLTMIQQLHIHSTADSNYTRKHTQNLIFACAHM